MPRIPLAFVVVALLLAVGAGAILGARAFSTTAPVVADTSAPVKHHSGTPAARAATIGDYRQLVASLATAEERHDFAAQSRFQGQLDKMLTPALIGKIYQQRQQLMADLAATGRDSHAALITRELRSLCGAEAVKAELAFCN